MYDVSFLKIPIIISMTTEYEQSPISPPRMHATVHIVKFWVHYINVLYYGDQMHLDNNLKNQDVPHKCDSFLIVEAEAQFY